jgi:hypothetical protein
MSESYVFITLGNVGVRFGEVPTSNKNSDSAKNSARPKIVPASAWELDIILVPNGRHVLWQFNRQEPRAKSRGAI